MKELTFALVLTAAGSSERFRRDNPEGRKKEYCLIDGRPVLYWSLKAFLDTPGIKAVVVTTPEGGEKDAREALGELVEGQVPVYFTPGGANRTQSVRNGVLHLAKKGIEVSLIAIHDGARPFVTPDLIQRILEGAATEGGAAPGIKVVDAVKRTDANGLVVENADRTNLVRVQTPQVFDRKTITKLYGKLGTDESYPDDIELYTSRGGRCLIVPGSEENIKITYKEDLEKRR